jgi:hypothetical protein
MQLELYVGKGNVSEHKQKQVSMSELSKNDYLPKGVLSMSRGRTLEAHKGKILEPQLRAKIDKEDDGLFIADEERVQGLSDNNLESKEDVSEEGLGS